MPVELRLSAHCVPYAALFFRIIFCFNVGTMRLAHYGINYREKAYQRNNRSHLGVAGIENRRVVMVGSRRTTAHQNESYKYYHYAYEESDKIAFVKGEVLSIHIVLYFLYFEDTHEAVICQVDIFTMSFLRITPFPLKIILFTEDSLY